MTWNESPTKADLAEEAARSDRQVEHFAEVAQEWRSSPVTAADFAKWGGGPTKYRVPLRASLPLVAEGVR